MPARSQIFYRTTTARERYRGGMSHMLLLLLLLSLLLLLLLLLLILALLYLSPFLLISDALRIYFVLVLNGPFEFENIWL